MYKETSCQFTAKDDAKEDIWQQIGSLRLQNLRLFEDSSTLHLPCTVQNFVNCDAHWLTKQTDQVI